MSQYFTGQDLRVGLFRIWIVLCGLWFLREGYGTYKQAAYCSTETGFSIGYCLQQHLLSNVFGKIFFFLGPPALLLVIGALLVALVSWPFRRR
jgi:hypothetical protein